MLGSEYEDLYRDTCSALFTAYLEALEPVKKVVMESVPRRPDEAEQRYDGRIRSRYVDVCRFLLPAAAYANLGMTINARTLEGAIRKMLTHPLDEVRAIGSSVKEVALQETPTLVKYAERDETALRIRASMNELVSGLPAKRSNEMLTLVQFDEEDEDRILAAALYEFSEAPFEHCLKTIQAYSQGERQAVAGELLSGLDKHDVPFRVLEHSRYTFDVLLDQGAYFELKRHRMMTQTAQPLTTNLGYSIPRMISEAGLGESYKKSMEQAMEGYVRLCELSPDVASYVVPNAFNRRVLCSLNLRQAQHFCELRSRANAHFSIRRIALRMAELLREVHPTLVQHFRLPEGADWQEIEERNFIQV